MPGGAAKESGWHAVKGRAGQHAHGSHHDSGEGMPQPIDMKRYAQLKTAGELPSPRGVAIAIIRLTQASDDDLPLIFAKQKIAEAAE